MRKRLNDTTKEVYMKKRYAILLIATIVSAEEITSFPSYQGFRGVVNTPNAEVLPQGEFELLYTNQIENLSPSDTPDFRDTKDQKNFFLNMGVLPNLDFSFQYVYGFDDVANQKHLSNRVVNAKYQIPYIDEDLFQVAIGLQDMGGGNRYIPSKYAVVSKEFKSLRTNLGYAQGDKEASLNGVFGSLEYQPTPWLYLAGEYDTREWNGAIKTSIPITIGDQPIDLGLMARSSLDHNNLYFGVYAKAPFQQTNQPSNKVEEVAFKEPVSIESLQLNNIDSSIKENTLYFSYENTLYTHNDIDALGMVLGILASSTNAKDIVVTTKKANIVQYSMQVNTKAYKEFLKTGKVTPQLLYFRSMNTNSHLNRTYSDQFKPTLTVQPDLVFIDGGEYSDVVDYTLAMQTELSMRLAKGTLLSGRYNIPISMTDNFKNGGVFSYRNRNKTNASLDQVLLSQYYKPLENQQWVNLLQVGRFDEELEGVSFESGVSDVSGSHQLRLKFAQLDDGFGNRMDRYSNDTRELRLLSYRYYLNSLNSNIKVTAGDFLYGDQGVSVDFERYFSDIRLSFNLSKTKHPTKGTNNLAKLSLNIPFGMSKRYKTEYLDIQGGDFEYVKRKNVVSGTQNSYALPHHIKELENSFTLEKYYLNNDRFQPEYIEHNLHRLRNVFIKNKYNRKT